MKKLSFILAMVLGTGMAMAQNTATVSTIGDYNTNYVNQLGSDNTAKVTQFGDFNTADVSDNQASTLFSILTDTKGIMQDGKENKGTIDQYNGNGSIDRNNGPIAGLGQKGDKNTATITQKHNSLWMSEFAWTKQEKDGNTSLQNQDKTYAYSHILQQSAIFANPEDAASTVGNTAETQQLGGYNQRANILQIGERNNAYQFQGSNIFAYTLNNLAEATQKGKDNISSQTQNGSSNIAKTSQLSNFNTANLIQNGVASANPPLVGNFATILQETGDYNTVNLTQNGGAQADILQNGDHNTLMGIGLEIMATSLNGSKLELDQLGSNNTLHLQQTNGASATVYQNGLTNTSVVIQN